MEKITTALVAIVTLITVSCVAGLPWTDYPVRWDELKTGFTVQCVVAWVREETVGVEFATAVDVLEILSNSVDGPRPRMPRIEVDCFATVRDGATVHRMRVHDVSQGGVKLETAVVLTKGSDLVVSLQGLTPQPAAVLAESADSAQS